MTGAERIGAVMQRWILGAATVMWLSAFAPSATALTTETVASVACATARTCVIAGSLGAAGGNKTVTLAAGWSGLRWSRQPTPNPVVPPSFAPYADSELSSVSCPAPTACFAVGHYTNYNVPPPVFPHPPKPFATQTLAERWDGRHWSIMATPNLATRDKSALTSVSCTSSTACTAVGWARNTTNPYHRNATGHSVTLAERWDGTRWLIEPTPNVPRRTDSLFTSVSCSSPHDCTAVGLGANPPPSPAQQALAERWDGRTWSLTRMPSNATTSSPTSVSCSTPDVCIAVGDEAWLWNGTRWATLRIAPARYASLIAVACTSARACIAVGQSAGTRTAQTLAERWNGRKWTIQRAPTPRGGYGFGLLAVSCSAPTACTAVGGNVALYSYPFVERWNGHHWSIQRKPKLF